MVCKAISKTSPKFSILNSQCFGNSLSVTLSECLSKVEPKKYPVFEIAFSQSKMKHDEYVTRQFIDSWVIIHYQTLFLQFRENVKRALLPEYTEVLFDE